MTSPTRPAHKESRMSTRPLLDPNINVPFVNAVSMATSITSPVTFLKGLSSFGYDLTWTGTPVGTFSVQVSNTYSQSPTGAVINAGSWTTLPSAAFEGTYPIPSGSASNGYLDIVGTSAAFARLVYTASSSTGSLTVVIAGRVL